MLYSAPFEAFAGEKVREIATSAMVITANAMGAKAVLFTGFPPLCLRF
jgi:hypothetical protein